MRRRPLGPARQPTREPDWRVGLRRYRLPRARLPIDAGRVLLRTPRLSDEPDWYRILTHPEVLRAMQPESSWDHAGVRAKILAARRDLKRGRRVEVTVVRREPERVIGRVALKEIDPFHRRAEIGYWFDPAVWGEGLAAEAVHGLCEHAFARMGLLRIDAQIYAFNARSQRLVRRLGFRNEGVLRDAYSAWSGRQDELRFGVLRGELRAPR